MHFNKTKASVAGFCFVILNTMHRIEAIDFHRFVLMALMALAHTFSFIVGVGYSEFWFATLPGSFSAVRVISHVVAPGFFMIMGIGVALFIVKGVQKKYPLKKIRLMLIRRGMALIFIQFFIVNVVWFFESQASDGLTLLDYYTGMFGFGSHTYYFGVLWALGMSLILAGIFCGVCLRKVVLLSVVFFLISALYIYAIKLGVFDPTLFLSPLLFPYQWESMLVFYPVLPWAGIVFLGMIIGRWISERGAMASSHLMKSGLVLAALGLLLRVFSLGNAPFNEYDSVASFLSFTKYSPSVVFASLTIGINLCFLSLLLKWVPKSNILKKMSILGKVSLHFYVIHLIVLLAISSLLSKNHNTAFVATGVWFVVLIVTYPASLLLSSLSRRRFL